MAGPESEERYRVFPETNPAAIIRHYGNNVWSYLKITHHCGQPAKDFAAVARLREKLVW
jgi:hypothetical protein